MLRNNFKYVFKNYSIIGAPVNAWMEHARFKSDVGSSENIDNPTKVESKRMAEFRKKLRETTSIDDLGEQPLMHPSQDDDPLPPWPNNTNPHTGEIGGPRGLEPTRYGDWERKGRVSDF